MARTIIAAVLLLLAVYIAVMNWGCVIVSLRNQKKGIDKHHSQVFIFHNILPIAAFFLYPHSPKWWIWLIPALDLSNLTLLAWPFLLLKEKRNKRPNILHAIGGGRRSVRITLSRRAARRLNGANRMKKRTTIAVSICTMVLLVVGIFFYFNRHRALVRQPGLFIKCAFAKNIHTGRWSHMLTTVDYFWWSYRVRIGRWGEWHCLPFFRPAPVTDQNAGMTFNDDIEVVIEFTEEAQQPAPQPAAQVQPEGAPSD